MPRIFRRALVEQDLVNIWLYTFNEWGEKQANKYLDDLDRAIKLLAEQPLISRMRTELDPPVRLHHHGNNLIVYLAGDDGISIVRILHESMVVDGHLK